MKISCESEELIKELEQDIEEFGENEIVVAFYKFYTGVKIYTNYDFITEDDPVTSDELLPDEFMEKITMKELLEKLIEQDRIV